jgi:hypothetical protein
MDINKLTPEQLRKAADLRESIDALQEELNEVLGGEIPSPFQVAVEAEPEPGNGRRRKKRKPVSAEGRANISAAAKARWAARKMAKGNAEPAVEAWQPVEKPKKKRSAAWSRALSEAMKARWARARKAGKSRL